jgi:outer membrane protein assembly factor BamB
VYAGLSYWRAHFRKPPPAADALNLLALRGDTGETLWQRRLGVMVETVTVEGDRVYAVCADDQVKRTVVCLNRADGQELWRQATTRANYPHMQGLVMCGGNVVLVGDTGMWAIALAAPHARAWSVDYGQQAGMGVTVAGDAAYVSTFGRLIKYDLRAGRAAWEYKTNADGPVGAADGEVCLITFGGGTLLDWTEPETPSPAPQSATSEEPPLGAVPDDLADVLLRRGALVTTSASGATPGRGRVAGGLVVLLALAGGGAAVLRRRR